MQPVSSLLEPVADSPMLMAVRWVQGAMLGEAANVVAILSVAAVGAMMLAGRVELRRGTLAVLGCFLLFGAATIAAGIRNAVDFAVTDGPGSAYVAAPVVVIPPIAIPVRRSNDDPYAGASVFPRGR